MPFSRIVERHFVLVQKYEKQKRKRFPFPFFFEMPKVYQVECDKK